MFCFAEDNNIISGLRKYNCGIGLKKTRILNTLLVVRSCKPGDNLLSPTMLYIFGFLTGLSLSSANFPQDIQILILFLYSKGVIKANLFQRQHLVCIVKDYKGPFSRSTSFSNGYFNGHLLKTN